MEKRDRSHRYGKAPSLIYTCSGVADVGAIADLAGRKLNAERVGKMSCIAGIAAQISDIVGAGRSAGKIVAIDGCDFDCTKRVLELAGFHRFAHIRVADHGMPKGESPPTDERVEAIASLAKSALIEG